MSIRLAALIPLALCSTLAAAATYRWVDENGVVSYSDRPQPGAEEIELRGAQSYQAPRPRPRAVERAPAAAAEDVDDFSQGYDSVAISSPTEGETLFNIGGTMTVTVSVSPPLAETHGVTLFYDGRPVTERPERRTTFQVEEVWRGEHTLRAAISDANGQLVSDSPTITFYVRQTTIR